MGTYFARCKRVDDDETDADALPALMGAGIRSVAVPLWMRDEPTTMRLAADALDLARGTLSVV